jgi:hypothetical protein
VGTITKTLRFVQAEAAAAAARAPRALLLHPPVYDFALYDLFLKPYALCRLGAWLESCGYKVRLVNALDYSDPRSRQLLGSPRRERRGTGKFFRQVVETPAVLSELARSYARYGMVAESLEERIGAEQPDIVFLSAGMSYWYPGVVEAIRAVRRFFPRVPVVLGGIYPTLCPEHARRQSGADFVISGPAFPELPELLRSLSLPASQSWEEERLLLLPEANWEAGVLRLNRGCPFSCAYCASHRINPGFSAGRPELLLRTVTEMHGRYGTRNFAFYDDALLAGKERAFLQFLESVLASGLRLSFFLPNAVHLCFLDVPTAAAMKRSGFREVRLGFESARPGFHDSLDRKLKPGMLAAGLETLFQGGFQPRDVIAYVLAGLPEQRAGEVEESIRYAASFGIRVQVAEYSPTPGSSLWPQAVRLSSFPLAEEPLTHNNTLLPMRWPGLTVRDLEELKALARRLSQG